MNHLAQAFRACAAERLLAGDVIRASVYLHEAHKLECSFWTEQLVAASMKDLENRVEDAAPTKSRSFLNESC